MIFVTIPLTAPLTIAIAIRTLAFTAPRSASMLFTVTI